ncbi:MAG: hypothetical protein U1E65_29190 [Myxococcota bacterium]
MRRGAGIAATLLVACLRAPTPVSGPSPEAATKILVAVQKNLGVSASLLTDGTALLGQLDPDVRWFILTSAKTPAELELELVGDRLELAGTSLELTSIDKPERSRPLPPELDAYVYSGTRFEPTATNIPPLDALRLSYRPCPDPVETEVFGLAETHQSIAAILPDAQGRIWVPTHEGERETGEVEGVQLYRVRTGSAARMRALEHALRLELLDTYHDPSGFVFEGQAYLVLDDGHVARLDDSGAELVSSNLFPGGRRSLSAAVGVRTAAGFEVYAMARPFDALNGELYRQTVGVTPWVATHVPYATAFRQDCGYALDTILTAEADGSIRFTLQSGYANTYDPTTGRFIREALVAEADIQCRAAVYTTSHGQVGTVGSSGSLGNLVRKGPSGWETILSDSEISGRGLVEAGPELFVFVRDPGLRAFRIFERASAPPVVARCPGVLGSIKQMRLATYVGDRLFYESGSTDTTALSSARLPLTSP